MKEPSPEALDALIEANTELMDLTIDPAWVPSIRQNLATTYRLARFVDAFELPDEAEPAPVYEA
jgi:hypothetical protein